MKRTIYPGLLLVVCFTALTLPGCGGDDETACDRAHAKFCACPTVTCTGKPSSCTGPDLEWAECINSAPDACTANCLPM
jgi:hypothetical protein